MNLGPVAVIRTTSFWPAPSGLFTGKQWDANVVLATVIASNTPPARLRPTRRMAKPPLCLIPGREIVVRLGIARPRPEHRPRPQLTRQRGRPALGRLFRCGGPRLNAAWRTPRRPARG